LPKPPAIDVTPLGIKFLVVIPGLGDSPAAMLVLALAAPVLAESIILRKNPLFLGFGATRPPSMLESAEEPCQPA
jgi:hypothetical protein